MPVPPPDPARVRGFAASIARHCAALPGGSCTLMEVCGTHTQAIARWALRDLLPPGLRLVSGPGCPVCVTPGGWIDQAAEAARRGAIVATFGDLVRVPGRTTSLEAARAADGRIEVLASPLDAIALARTTARPVVFLGVGFETTAVPIAAAIREAAIAGPDNLSFLLSLRLVPPALRALLADPEVRIDGFLLPGHVSTVIGLDPYGFLAERRTPGAVAGFEPESLLAAIDWLVGRLRPDMPSDARWLENFYPRAVRPEGNPEARRLLAELFEPCDAVWRGIGTLPGSGLRLKPEWAHLDAARRFGFPPVAEDPPEACRCGRVLKGALLPPECPLFGRGCTPETPVGPCMVSGEGSCAAWFRTAPSV